GSTGFSGGDVDQFDTGVFQLVVDKAGEQHRVGFGHIGSPEDIGIPQVQVVIAAHRFIGAEGIHEGYDRRGHAEAGVGLQVVGADPPLHQLGGGVALVDGPLAGTVHGNRIGAVGGNGFLVL